MSNDKTTKNIREEIVDTFDDDFVNGYGSLIHGEAKKFYEKYDFEGIVFFDEVIFGDCLIDILVDLKRLKYFHELKNISYERLMAYAASWCIKRKPFQMIEGYGNRDNANKYKYVNEKFAFMMLLDGADFDSGKYKVDKEARQEIFQTLDRMLYHLRYRNTSPRTLELMLYGIKCGRYMSE